MSRPTSPLWKQFTILEGNFRSVKCNHCDVFVQRGNENAPKSKCYNRNMQKHLSRHHGELMEEVTKDQEAVKVFNKAKKIDDLDESVRGTIPIFDLRSQADRAEFISKVSLIIPLFIVLELQLAMLASFLPLWGAGDLFRPCWGLINTHAYLYIPFHTHTYQK